MSRIELESKVLDFVHRQNLVSPREIVVVAISGGADSVCLLHLLARWQGKLDIKLHIAHLNHQLRGLESEADALYVADLAKQVGVPITIDGQDVVAYRADRKCSLEEAARELRYDFLAQVAEKVKASRVALGHTRDDQVETILMHILRGTGTLGLRGLEACSPLPCHHSALKLKPPRLLLIRPLLDITREETVNYCQLQRLGPRFDSSNLSLSFLRNRLRLELLPLLRKYNANVDQALLRLAEIARDDNSFIKQQASQFWNEVAKQEDDVIHLKKREILALPIALQRQLIRLAIDSVLGDTKDIEANHIEALRGLLSKPAGKRISLPRDLTGQSGHDEIAIAANRGPGPYVPCPFLPIERDFSLKVPGETLLPGWRVVAKIAPFKAGQNFEFGEAHSPFPPASNVIVDRRRSNLSFPLKGVGKESVLGLSKDESDFLAHFDLQQTGTALLVRRRQPGDRFQPLGMDLPKKLQDFMVDNKIPSFWRDSIPLVCAPGQIVWVVGWRIDHRVKVTEATKEVLRLEFIKSS